MTILPVLQQGQCRRLQKAVSVRVFQLTNEKGATTALFKAIYSALKERFNVESYKSIEPKDFQKALRFIENWKG